MSRRDRTRLLSALLLTGLAVACTGSQPAGQASTPPAPPTYPDQRLATPVNDLPGPYTRVHPWSELAYDAKVYDNRAAVIGVAEGPDGNIYVLTRCNRNSCKDRPEPPISKFTPDGRLLQAWGQGLFEFPHNLTIDTQGNVWTTDEGNHVVRKFTAAGELLLTIGEVGQAGDAPTRLTSPTAVVVGPDGNVYVSEGHDNSPTARVARLSKWRPDGTFIKTWGRTGPEPGNFSTPHTLAFDSKGRLFAGDRNNNRIQIFDQEGTLLDIWYQFGRPSGIIITKDDRIYVADSESYDFHNPGWEKGIRIGDAKTGTVEFFIRDLEPTTVTHSGAEGIGVDSKGNIYGAVVRRRMLEKHAPNAGAQAAAAAAAPASPQAASQALAHFGHVATGFADAPAGRGLVMTAALDANAAMMHANIAALSPTDLNAMKMHATHVLHALAPEAGAQGPGSGYGLRKAVDAVATHMEMALTAPGASATMKKFGPAAVGSARAVSARAQALAGLAAQVLAATTPAEAAPIAEQMRVMGLALDQGTDVNGSGRIDVDAVEPGLNHLEAQIYSIFEGEQLPRVLR